MTELFNPYFDNPPEQFKAGCLNEAIDNYIGNPSDENLSEIRHYQDEEHIKRNKIRELKSFLQGLADDKNGTASVVLHKMKGI